MSNDRWDATFEDFIANIVLTKTQAKKIDSSLVSLSKLFLERLDVKDIEIYVQGSFSTNTTVKPLTITQTGGDAGEYDVDIVIQSSDWAGARDSLRDIENVLKSHEFYAGKIVDDKKSSCERVDYGSDDSGVGYHVDIVPIRKIATACDKANRESNTWSQSESKKLTDWLNEFADNNPHFRTIVLAAKRLRDVLGLTDILPSTILIVLLARHYEDQLSYVDDFLHCLEAICHEFNAGLDELSIDNPVQDEDLAERYRQAPKDYSEIGQKMQSAFNTLSEAFESNDVDSIRQNLSDDFPQLLPQNVHSLRMHGHVMQTDGSFETASIASSSQFGQVQSTFKRIFYEMSKPISFQGDNKYSGCKVKWQVCNAIGSKEVRGDWFLARAVGGSPGSSVNPVINNETEVYVGEHWTRYAAIDADNKVIALSPRYKVEVKSNGPGYVRR